MTGRAEVARLKQRLDATFARFHLVGEDLEARADFARYLCVLVSGYIERAVEELAIEHCRTWGPRTVLSFSTSTLRRLQNVNCEKLLNLLGRFDLQWMHEAEAFVVDDRKTALDSVVALRNQIAHGENVGVTFARVDAYYQSAQEVLDFVADRFCPLGP